MYRFILSTGGCWSWSTLRPVIHSFYGATKSRLCIPCDLRNIQKECGISRKFCNFRINGAIWCEVTLIQ